MLGKSIGCVLISCGILCSLCAEGPQSSGFFSSSWHRGIGGFSKPHAPLPHGRFQERYLFLSHFSCALMLLLFWAPEILLTPLLPSLKPPPPNKHTLLSWTIQNQSQNLLKVSVILPNASDLSCATGASYRDPCWRFSIFSSGPGRAQRASPLNVVGCAKCHWQPRPPD